MKKSITITIPEPCHEDWGKMTATEKGKFCAVCTKEVIDFTKTNDEDLVKKLEAGGNLCGRFNKSQLNREVKLERKSKNSFLPYAASLLLPLSVLGTSTANSNTFEKPMISLGIGSNPSNETDKSIVTVTGVITDNQGNPINNAEILVLESGETFFSEKDGSYLLKCVSGSTLVFQKAGREEHQVTIGGHNSVVNVLLKSEIFTQPQILGRIAIPEVATEINCTESVIEEISILEETIEVPMGDIVVEEKISEEEKDVIKIVGTITDETGIPLPGVNVLEKGTDNSTQTDFDGNYKIEIASNQVLVYSNITYETKEITMANIDNTVSFSMEPDDYLMGEVITVGLVITVEQDSGFNINPYRTRSNHNEYDPEREETKRLRKLAAKNEAEFKKIKRAREKSKRNKK